MEVHLSKRNVNLIDEEGNIVAYSHERKWIPYPGMVERLRHMEEEGEVPGTSVTVRQAAGQTMSLVTNFVKKLVTRD
jgi:hypothetical protein